MRTPYSGVNQEFSAVSHELAKKSVYPMLFGNTDLEFSYPGGERDEVSRIYDAKMNVDTIARVKVPSLQGRLSFLLQERFRAKDALKYGDITITEWNHKTNNPSELYKMTAGFFVYGITDGEISEVQDERTRLKVRVITKYPTQFLNIYVIDVAHLYLGLSRKLIRWSEHHNPRSEQTFIALSIQDLVDAGVVVWQNNLSLVS